MSLLRTTVALSRPARLPTVWSNCLAGWWLGGGTNTEQLPLLFGAVTLLYFGGAFLNDAFDVEHDQQHRPTRPIPAGSVTSALVWRWALGFLVAGGLLLMWVGTLTGILGLALILCIVLFNTLRRLKAVSPIFGGLCRLFVYVVGASVALYGVTGWSVWCGLALAIYVAGIGYSEHWAEQPSRAKAWPAILLAVPLVLALALDTNGYRQAALLLSALLVLWVLRALRQTFWTAEPNVPSTLAGLLSGIVFVDWLATCPVPTLAGELNPGARELSFAFIALLLLTVVLQNLTKDA